MASAAPSMTESPTTKSRGRSAASARGRDRSEQGGADGEQQGHDHGLGPAPPHVSARVTAVAAPASTTTTTKGHRRASPAAAATSPTTRASSTHRPSSTTVEVTTSAASSGTGSAPRPSSRQRAGSQHQRAGGLQDVRPERQGRQGDPDPAHAAPVGRSGPVGLAGPVGRPAAPWAAPRPPPPRRRPPGSPPAPPARAGTRRARRAPPRRVRVVEAGHTSARKAAGMVASMPRVVTSEPDPDRIEAPRTVAAFHATNTPAPVTR